MCVKLYKMAEPLLQGRQRRDGRKHGAAQALGREANCCGKPPSAAARNQDRLNPWQAAILTGLYLLIS